MPPETKPSPAVDLNTPIQFIKGCGPARAELLAKLGIATLRDLLFFFPRDYQDLTAVSSVDQLEEGKLVTLLARVEEIDMRSRGDGRSVLGVLVRQDNAFLRALWFNMPFMRDKFQPGQFVLLTGKPKLQQMRWELVHPQVQWVESEQDTPKGELLPVYPLTEGLGQRQTRSVVKQGLEVGVGLIDEVFPESYLSEHDLLPIRQALPQLHFPDGREHLQQARRRFVYQELLVQQLALALKRAQVVGGIPALPLPVSAKIDARIRRLFPYALTDGQNQAIGEIAADLARVVPMNRLLQGEVGSGKTAVAVYAMLLAIAHGAQAALMAPTEILAQQHYRTLQSLLAESQVKIGLLTGGLTGRARQELLSSVERGETQILVGTQAVVQSEVAFQNLALVVIDEQHKFGVRQRALLKQAGIQAHYLVMTATPIPRTISMTLFGDLDVTSLRELPPGRQPVHTYLPPIEQHEKWWDFYRKKLLEGRQGYVVVPLVEQSDQIAAASLQEAYEHLANGELEAFRLGLAHGRMESEEKEAAMERLRRGDTQVLVATSVVEVGVDVPNATLMTIQGAERFGLAQLHQLRGRISRGRYPGYCCLLADPQTDDARKRLDAFVSTTDGFQLAEIDFALRGPGDLLGTRQHGLPPLRIADLQRDTALLEEARRDAQAIINADPTLDNPQFTALRRMAINRYGGTLQLGDVG